MRAQGIPTTSARGTPPGDAPFNSVWSTGFTYDHNNLAGFKLSTLLFSQEYEALFGATNSQSFQDTTIAPNKTLYDQSRAVSSKLGAKLALTRDDLLEDTLKVTAGFDVLLDKNKQDLYLTKRTYVPEIEYTNYSSFLQTEYALLDNVTLHAGVRHEIAKLKVDDYRTQSADANDAYDGVAVKGGTPKFNQTLYNVGIVYSPWEPLSLVHQLLGRVWYAGCRTCTARY